MFNEHSVVCQKSQIMMHNLYPVFKRNRLRMVLYMICHQRTIRLANRRRQHQQGQVQQDVTVGHIFIFDELAVVLPLVVSFDIVDLGVDDVKSGVLIAVFFVSRAKLWT